jgi:hypothetical protein
MGHSRTTRLAAAAAALLFLGGTTAVSSLDALLFHRGARGAVVVPHVEPGGAASHHADQCLLTFRLANGRLSAGLSHAIRFVALASRPAAAPPPAAPVRFYPGLHQQSRAPPTAPLA